MKIIFYGGLILGQLAIFQGHVQAGPKDEPMDGPPEIMLQEQTLPERQMGNAAEASREVITIAGTVNDNYQLVTANGEVYEIAETEAGDELVGHIGQKVKAKGRVSVVDEQKVLSVISFESVK